MDEVNRLESIISTGNQRLAEGHLLEAEALFSEAIKKAPHWSLPRLARARVAFSAGKYHEVVEDTMYGFFDDATEPFRRLLKVNKNNVDAILLRGEAFKYLGDLDAAQK